jgi:hypothetical protein
MEFVGNINKIRGVILSYYKISKQTIWLQNYRIILIIFKML